MRRCYGTEERALEALNRQPFLLNPTYTWPPPLLSRSKAALVQVLGSEEEALEVMRKNPAVLQCGAPGILELGADEIKLFADLRYAGSLVPPQTAAGLGIAFGLLVLLTIAANAGSSSAGDEAFFAPLLMISKPLLGLVFAAAIEGSRIAIVGAVVSGQMRKREERDVKVSGELVEQRKEQLKQIRSAGGWSTLVTNMASRVVPKARE